MSDETPIDRPQPAGLGGWLWPVTWVVAALPLLLASDLISRLSEALVFIVRHGQVPYPLSEAWGLRDMAVLLSMTTIAWWWTILWFARDPRIVRQAHYLLLVGSGSVFLVAWFERHPTDYTVLAAILCCLAIAALLCARWSKLVRNTFVVGAMPTEAIAWKNVVFGGPRDWSRGYWLIPGTLLSAALWLLFALPFFADAALQAIPPPPPPMPFLSGNAAALERLFAYDHPGRYIEASRVALVLSLVAGLLVACAFAGLARGARWTAGITVAALAFGMAAPLWMDLRDWCCPFHHDPPLATMWRPWCGLLILAIFRTILGHRSNATAPAEAMRT